MHRTQSAAAANDLRQCTILQFAEWYNAESRIVADANGQLGCRG